MICAQHNDEPLSPRPFQRASAAWLPLWCKRCGRIEFGLRAPRVEELEEQPPPLDGIVSFWHYICTTMEVA